MRHFYDIIQNCLAQLNIQDYKQAVMVGDSEHDANGAKEAGIDFIGVLYGFGFKKESDITAYKNVGCAKDVKSLGEFMK